MHTPEEAKELWCPMVRIARRETERDGSPTYEYTNVGPGDTYVVGGCNTDALGRNRVPASCRCIANQCAMWRWHPKTKLNVDTGELYLQGRTTLTSDRIPAKGYCGLAPLHAN